MNKTIIRSIKEASSLNPETSTLLLFKRKINLQVNYVLSGNLSVNNSNLQSITNNRGTITRITNHSNNSLELERLKQENKALKEALSDKQDIIDLLKQQNNSS